MRQIFASTAATLAMAGASQAEVPLVVTDILPVHSIVAQVMGDLGTPELLLDGNADPHNFQMRPSQVRALSNADVLVWIGPEMTPWLERAVESSTQASVVTLLHLPDLPARYVALTEHDHGAHGDEHDDHHDEADHDDKDHDEHAHEEHGEDEEHHDEHAHDHEEHDEHADEHAHDEHAKEEHEEHAHEDHDDHGHEEEEHDEHAHDEHGHDDEKGLDPHAWLDPLNAAAFALAVADALSKTDPENADVYAANALAASQEMKDIATSYDMSKLSNVVMLPYHDAYQYAFERFGLNHQGAIANIHGQAPSAGEISEIRAVIEASEKACVFSEPGADTRLLDLVAPDLPRAVLDPLGSAFDPGPELYAALMQDMANTISTCLDG